MHAQDARDFHQGADADVMRAGLDALVGGPADACGEEDAFLGAVLSKAGDPDAVADGLTLLEEPVVVIGEPRHSTNARAKLIISQPGKPGLS